MRLTTWEGLKETAKAQLTQNGRRGLLRAPPSPRVQTLLELLAKPRAAPATGCPRGALTRTVPSSEPRSVAWEMATPTGSRTSAPASWAAVVSVPGGQRQPAGGLAWSVGCGGLSHASAQSLYRETNSVRNPSAIRPSRPPGVGPGRGLPWRQLAPRPEAGLHTERLPHKTQRPSPGLGGGGGPQRGPPSWKLRGAEKGVPVSGLSLFAEFGETSLGGWPSLSPWQAPP